LKHAVKTSDEKKPPRKKKAPSHGDLPKQASARGARMARTSSFGAATLGQLQDIAATIGISKTAPKAALIARLTDALRNHTPPPPDARVLSIDLGIRNLAYALVTPGPVPYTKKAGLPDAQTSAQQKPVVHAWNRVDLRHLTAAAVEADASLDTNITVTEDFTPPSLSTMALRLVQQHLLPLNPTHILIEQQRFRSAGGSSILEWTVRVNSLESMLYAVFATLKALGHWDGVVIPVDPRRVGPYLLEAASGRAGEAVKTGRKVKVGSKENKKLKIDLVGRWLSGKAGVVVGSQAEEVKGAFLRRWLPREKKSKGQKDDDGAERGRVFDKLDDVSDCLLQGVAWLKWEENKSLLAKQYRGMLE
jgi:cruciform cutting endonuclease 1